MKMTRRSPTFSFTQRSATRPSVSPVRRCRVPSQRLKNAALSGVDPYRQKSQLRCIRTRHRPGALA